MMSTNKKHKRLPPQKKTFKKTRAKTFFYIINSNIQNFTLNSTSQIPQPRALWRNNWNYFSI